VCVSVCKCEAAIKEKTSFQHESHQKKTTSTTKKNDKHKGKYRVEIILDDVCSTLKHPFASSPTHTHMQSSNFSLCAVSICVMGVCKSVCVCVCCVCGVCVLCVCMCVCKCV
jgi:hypothetical protein